MVRISNARTIADIEFVIDAPNLGVTKRRGSLTALNVDRHRFNRQSYSFSFEVVYLRLQISFLHAAAKASEVATP